MKWKEVLYMLNNQKIITSEEVVTLLDLHKLRDEIFFPDYKQYGYQGGNINHYLLNDNELVHSFDISLVSVKANRKLGLKFILGIVEGKTVFGFLDSILILNPKPGWGNYINMETLIEKKVGKEIKFQYNMLAAHKGNFRKKLTACFNHIKFNYDTYARDIIAGEYWDSKAYDGSYL